MKNKENKRIDKELSRLGREIEQELEEDIRAAEAQAAPNADMLFDDELDDLTDEELAALELDDEDLEDFDDEELDDEDFDDDDLDDEDFDDEDFDDEDLEDLDDEELDDELFERKKRKKSKGGSGALVAILVVLIVLLAGGAALWVMTGTRDITFEAADYAIRLGETQKLEPVFTPKFARNKNYTLVSSDGEVITFQDGAITGAKVGKATLTAVQNGKEYGRCTVTVLPVAVESITVTGPDEMYVGDTLELTVNVLPENASDRTIEYTFSDDTLATAENGVITLTGAGELTVTATNPQSGVSASHTLTVIATDPEQIIISVPDMIELSDTAQPSVSFVPEHVADSGITWSSSDPSVFTVENGTVVPHATGSAMLIATHASGLYANVGIDIVPVQGREVTIESDFGNTLDVKDKKTLKATVSPAEAADKTLTWSSSDESVVTVSDKGVVVAKASGEAEITATLKNGIKGTFKISVPPKAVKQKAGFVNKPAAKTKTAVTMIAPENYNLYIAFRSTDGDEKKSFTVFVTEGKTLKAKLPEGSYYVTLTIGPTWYGGNVWFFNEGEYYALKEPFEVTANAKLDCSMPGADDAFETITAADFGG